MASTLWVINAAEDGTLRSAVTAAGEGALAVRPLKQWYGSRNCGFEMRWKSSGITDFRAEAGFIDATTAVGTTFVNNISTPTFNTVAEGAVAMFDNVSATTVEGLYTVTAGAGGAQKVAYTAPALVAATYRVWRIQMHAALADLWVDGQLVAQAATGSIDGTAGLIWAFNITGSATTTNTIDWDYVEMWKGRN